jgi:hypothetical protein
MLIPLMRAKFQIATGIERSWTWYMSFLVEIIMFEKKK